MRIIKELKNFWLIGLGISFLVSCQQTVQPVMNAKQAYLPFAEGIHQLANGLMNNLQKQQGIMPRIQGALQTVVFNPFVELDSGQVLQVSLEIEALFGEEVRQNFKNFQLVRLHTQSLQQADYIINGVIQYVANFSQHKTRKYYQVSAAIVDLKTKSIVTNGKVWIVTEGEVLDYRPTPSYQDNPMYIKGPLLQGLIDTVANSVGAKVDIDYYALMETKALLVEAQTAYDNGYYERARQLFKNLIQREDGKIIEAYGGLYMTDFKLDQLEEAEENFGKMVAVGIAMGKLPIKFLFQSHLTDFVDVPSLQQQYTIWLRQISLYFGKHTDKCVNIVGHTSKYGSYEHNKRLSKRRADKIQEFMSGFVADIIQRSRTDGKGSDETIVGTIPDSTENAIDRRVEFDIVDC
jgi:outer membrane protein OmpA-like peptidoglycan-associated protein